MAAKKVGDLAVKTGTYQVGRETKGRYMNVGALMENDEGENFILLNAMFNPAGIAAINNDGRDTIIVSVFEPRDGNDGDGDGGDDKGSKGNGNTRRQRGSK